jgi:D-glycero-D-manno-heptose 1,7-bisphosphate phosphatase
MSKALFWDLTGTLGGQATSDIRQMEFFPFTFEALRLSSANGYLNIIITNQSAISKGKLTMEEYERRAEELRGILAANRANVEEFLCCPHARGDNCSCKKPKTSLVDYCVEKYSIDRKASFVIGDMGKNEIVLARNAGMKGILVLTGGGRGSLGEFRYTWAGYEADTIAENALTAVQWILQAHPEN